MNKEAYKCIGKKDMKCLLEDKLNALCSAKEVVRVLERDYIQALRCATESGCHPEAEIAFGIWENSKYNQMASTSGFSVDPLDE